MNEYSGTLFGLPLIGKKISELQQNIPTEYDDGDEMHYPKNESGIHGIAFFTDGSSLGVHPDQAITGFSILDWSQAG